MLITTIFIKKTDGDTKLKAFASITLDNMIAIHDIKILFANEKYFLAMPSKRYEEEYRDITHPLCSEVREKFDELLIGAFNDSLKYDDTVVKYYYQINDKNLFEQSFEDFQMKINSL